MVKIEVIFAGANRQYMWQWLQDFGTAWLQAPWYEHVAVATGIASVWLSKKENVWLYPIGLISTIIYTVQSFQNHLLGEASVNFYYTMMSLLGWYWWLKKDKISKEYQLHISYSTKKEIILQILAFVGLFAILFSVLTFAKKNFYSGVIPWADGFATAAAFTGMFLMVRKKVESWYWWLATNIVSIPLYNTKDMKPTVIYYCILLVLAVLGLIEWKQKADKKNT